MKDATQTFLAAAADLLEQAIRDATQENPEELALLGRCVKAGGFLNIHANLSQTTGIAQIGIDIIEPNGEKHRLMSTTLEKIRTQ